MKKYLFLFFSICVSAFMHAQTITVINEANILISDVVFTLREGQKVTVPFYGKKTVTVPSGSMKFKIVSPAVYRNASTQVHDARITTKDIPLMTFDDLTFRVTMDGRRVKANKAELHIEEL